MYLVYFLGMLENINQGEALTEEKRVDTTSKRAGEERKSCEMGASELKRYHYDDMDRAVELRQ